jgi:hypothetical protein
MAGTGIDAFTSATSVAPTMERTVYFLAIIRVLISA